MIRILGMKSRISSDSSILGSLDSVYGLGRKNSLNVIAKLGINPRYPMNRMDEKTILKLNFLVEQNFPIEYELRRESLANIRRLSQTKSYRGIRHLAGLPVRGQRTHTNAQTRKRLGSKSKLLGSL